MWASRNLRTRNRVLGLILGFREPRILKVFSSGVVNSDVGFCLLWPFYGPRKIVRASREFSVMFRSSSRPLLCPTSSSIFLLLQLWLFWSWVSFPPPTGCSRDFSSHRSFFNFLDPKNCRLMFLMQVSADNDDMVEMFLSFVSQL